MIDFEFINGAKKKAEPILKFSLFHSDFNSAKNN
jgi:hypothetical protein